VRPPLPEDEALDRAAAPRPDELPLAPAPEGPPAAPLPGAPAAPPPMPARGGTFAALRHRDFRLFYAGQLLSLVGTWMQTTAQGWLVLELTDSALKLGVVTAVTSVPTFLFTLYAGAVADRSDKRRIIVWANAVALVAALVLGVLTQAALITYPMVLVLAFALGTANAFEIPTRQSFFVDLVGKDDLPNAIALNSVQFNGSRIVGPAVAGWMIGAAGTAACFFANGVSYLFVIASLLAMRLAPFRAPERREGTLENIREGLGYIRSVRAVRVLVWLIAAMSVLGFPYVMLMPVFARDVLHVGAKGLGALLAATGLGALLGGLALAAAGGRFRRGRMMLGGSLAFCVALLCFASSRSYPLSLALLGVIGFTMILNNASANALLQSEVPNHLRGRVMSVYVFMFVGTAPLGALQAGALSHWLGAPFALQAGAVALAATLLAAAWLVPELRDAA
jgi:MFS family permease